MERKWFETRVADYAPLIMLIIFFGFYLIAQFILIGCSSTAVCDPVKPAFVFTKAAEPVDTQGALVSETDKDGKVSISGSQQAMAKRYRDRFIWTFAVMAQILFCFLAILFFYITLKNSLSNSGALWRLGIAFFFSLLFAFGDSMPIAAPIFQQTIQSSAGGMPGIVVIIQIANAVTYAATIGAVIAACVVLARKKTAETAGTDAKFGELAHKYEDLRSILYVCTVLLVIGVLRMTASNNWNLTFMTVESSVAARIFFSGLTTMLGGFFTLLLAGIFIPAAYILQQRAKSLLKRSGLTASARSERLKEAGFTFSWINTLPRFAAIIAPLLTGGVTDLLNKLPNPFAP